MGAVVSLNEAGAGNNRTDQHYVDRPLSAECVGKGL